MVSDSQSEHLIKIQSLPEFKSESIVLAPILLDKEGLWDGKQTRWRIEVGHTGVVIGVYKDDKGNWLWSQNFNTYAKESDGNHQLNITSRYAYAIRSLLEWWNNIEESDLPFPKSDFLVGETNKLMNDVRTHLFGHAYIWEPHPNWKEHFRYKLNLGLLFRDQKAVKRLEELSNYYLKRQKEEEK